jgi:SPX domain protein involved in polyphosphate accumulation
VSQRKQTRFEVKMTVPALDLPRVRNWVGAHPEGFHTAYPPRQVNNIYFDSTDLSSYSENLAGVARRVKLRLRWYGDRVAFGRSTLELKCKSGLAGWKVSHPVESDIDLRSMDWTGVVQILRRESSDRFAFALDLACQPVMINRYRREYFVSSDEAVRITIDSPQTVFSQWARSRPNLTFETGQPHLAVIEAKADSRERERLADAVSGFPWFVGRHSKYVHGVQSILL